MLGVGVGPERDSGISPGPHSEPDARLRASGSPRIHAAVAVLVSGCELVHGVGMRVPR